MARTGAVAAIAALLVGCGRIPAATGSASSDSQSSATPPAPNSLRQIAVQCKQQSGALTESSSQNYASKPCGFSVDYPNTFIFEVHTAGHAPAALFAARAFESKYRGTRPPGQVDIRIYVRDAADLRSWVTTHTGPAYPYSDAYYWESVSNVADTTTQGKAAITFDWSWPGTPTIHALAFFHGMDTVFVIDWFAQDPSYAATVQRVEQTMVAKLREG